MVKVADPCPVTRLEDCIDKIGNAQFMLKFDLLKGYWQVPLTEIANDLSAFVTPECLYCCQVLPFGMKNAPATFQRLIHLVTSALHNTVCNPLWCCSKLHLDYVICYST